MTITVEMPSGMSEKDARRLMVAVGEISNILKEYTLDEDAIILDICTQAVQQVQRDYAGAPAGVPIQ